MATQPTPTPQPVKAPRLFIETVHGRMVDLSTGIEYTYAPKEVIRITGWMQSQLEAGKMRLVERPISAE